MVKVFKNALMNILPKGTIDAGGTIFVFKQEDGVIKEFEINESIARIRNRYEDIKSGKRDVVYCSYGVMGDVNITFRDSTVEFFDSSWIITFSRLDFERMLETA